MRNFFTPLMLFFYLAYATGFAVSKHYCHGELSSTQVGITTHEKGCCNDEQETSMACCNDEISFFKISDQQNTSEEIKVPVASLIFLYSNYSLDIPTSNSTEIYPQSTSPPLPPPIPKYISNCSLIIYG